MTAEKLDVLYQIRQALGVGAKPMLSELPDICRKLREENEERHHKVLSLILERDKYRMKAEENWQCRKEINAALGIEEGMDNDEALRVAMVTIRKLKSTDLRMFLGWESGMRSAAAIAKGTGAQAAAKAILEAIGEKR